MFSPCSAKRRASDKDLPLTINSKPDFIIYGHFVCQIAVKFDLEFIRKIMQAKT